ncbi:N-acetylglucosaminylphosphatidylinositol deacetylase [Babesia microti strain RI]|uniref:N-acetylglucosaminylphosphatidylinositol deacetylase n=1 Tax=Babesia microti (strain RI) TaxID=1133968 RepID=A0A1N6LXQ3_BABMR|nr:N-acetylglucosaminylphosphatidylinositol deacetylase [Babesia microti strain RI]SIO73647.1 N-acetylglucosaminylphosphatidylinositol deacetylase [Babesia microti strain RI]|eukprot:XP_021337725.1 N-acetylglucosaminylphosphatidylinositol deacetylase [Babesia microti strain RI]
MAGYLNVDVRVISKYFRTNFSYKRLGIMITLLIFLRNVMNVKNNLFIADLESALNINDETRDSFKKMAQYGQKPYGILFVTAHPDDETMFFMPTIRVLREYIHGYDKLEPPIKIYLLVFTNGNYYGKGEQREYCLAKICYSLGITEHVIHDPEIYDGIDEWPINRVANIIKIFVRENNIKTFTFDRHGVSYHPNHSSVYRGVEIAVNDLPKFWTFNLKTVSLFRKYLSIFSLYLPIFMDRTAALYTSPLKIFELMIIYWSEFRIHIPFWCLFSSYSYSNSYDVYLTPDDKVQNSFWKKSDADVNIETNDL